MPDLEELAAAIDRCSQCNFCLPACPVYREDRLESAGARARLSLARAVLVDRALPVSRRVRELLSRCLLCTNCVQGCPASVPVDDIVAAARAALYRPSPQGAFWRFLAGRPQTAGALAALLGGMGRLGGKLPAGTPAERRAFAVLGPVRARVAYFAGCGVNYLYPDTGAALLRALAANGVEVVVPAGQRCCGLPALAQGDRAAAREAVRANAAVLAALDVDAVVTDCTSCGYMLAVKAPALLAPDDPARAAAAAVAGRTREATEFLVALGLRGEPPRQAVRVTYHVPCHRHWHASLADAPLRIVEAVPGADLVPLREPRRCCGAGGAFFLTHRELSESIRRRKMEDIRGTGAGVVLTQCPACRYFLAQGLGEEVRVMHPLAFWGG